MQRQQWANVRTEATIWQLKQTTSVTFIRGKKKREGAPQEEALGSSPESGEKDDAQTKSTFSLGDVTEAFVLTDCVWQQEKLWKANDPQSRFPKNR